MVMINCVSQMDVPVPQVSFKTDFYQHISYFLLQTLSKELAVNHPPSFIGNYIAYGWLGEIF